MHADFRGNFEGRVPSRGERDVVQQTARRSQPPRRAAWRCCASPAVSRPHRARRGLGDKSCALGAQNDPSTPIVPHRHRFSSRRCYRPFVNARRALSRSGSEDPTASLRSNFMEESARSLGIGIWARVVLMVQLETGQWSRILPTRIRGQVHTWYLPNPYHGSGTVPASKSTLRLKPLPARACHPL